jgi:phosphoserine phosphatase
MKLVVFDVDGVLLDVNPGGFEHLARAIGKEDEVAELHREYESRKSKGPWGLEELASLFKGVSCDRLREISTHLCEVNLMTGAKETVERLRSWGYSIALLSSNPLVITEQLKTSLGADFICGNELESENGICTGRLKRKADRFTKAEVLEEIIEGNSIPQSNVFVVGDSITDIPMSRCGLLISFNSRTREFDEMASYVVKEKDLRKILDFIPI